ncbi:MAG: peptidyl-alpha-hydroxyglycine alpha-amidating lyase family protein [Isosphaeraceae bacterium]
MTAPLSSPKLQRLVLAIVLTFLVQSWGEVGLFAQTYPFKLSPYPNYPKVNVAVGYEVDAAWPSGSRGKAWGEMAGVAVDDHDHVWTFHRGDLPVQVYTAQGKFVRGWGQGLIGKAHQVRIDREGNVWLSDVGLHVVRKFTPEGKLLLTLGTPGEAGEDSTHFNMPTDMALTPAGDVFVTDGYGNNRVVHFDSAGRFLKSWGTMGSGPGQFSLPHAIALDSAGRLYVADRNNARVQVFDQSGRFLDEWRDLMVPWHIWVTAADEIYVCGSSPMRWGKLALPGMVMGVAPKDQLMMRFNPGGRVLQVWSFPVGVTGKERPGELNWAHAIAVDSLGNLYLGDIQGHRAQKFVRQASDAPAGGPATLAEQPRRDPSVKPAAAPK